MVPRWSYLNAVSLQLRQSIILRFVVSVFFAPELHRWIDHFLAEFRRADTAIVPWIFLCVETAKKLCVGIGELTVEVLRARRLPDLAPIRARWPCPASSRE